MSSVLDAQPRTTFLEPVDPAVLGTTDRATRTTPTSVGEKGAFHNADSERGTCVIAAVRKLIIRPPINAAQTVCLQAGNNPILPTRGSKIGAAGASQF